VKTATLHMICVGQSLAGHVANSSTVKRHSFDFGPRRSIQINCFFRFLGAANGFVHNYRSWTLGQGFLNFPFIVRLLNEPVMNGKFRTAVA
jgi:hypothetical protein